AAAIPAAATEHRHRGRHAPHRGRCPKVHGAKVPHVRRKLRTEPDLAHPGCDEGRFLVTTERIRHEPDNRYRQGKVEASLVYGSESEPQPFPAVALVRRGGGFSVQSPNAPRTPIVTQVCQAVSAMSE